MKPSPTASPSFFSHPNTAGRVDPEAGSSGISGHSTGTFSGKGISNRPPHGDTATPLSEGKCIEDAFWEKKPLQGRQITSSDVLAAYGNDKTSLRGGLFLQKLCLQKIPHDNRKVTPDDVIQEFNRVPDQNNESMLAIEHFKDELASAHAAEEARLKVECYLRGDVGKGLQVTKDEALAAIEFLRKEESFPLPLARFKSQFSLRDLARHGQRAAPVAVQRDNPFRMPGNEIENTSANQRYRKSG